MTEPIRVLQVVASLNAGGMENYIMNLYRMVDKSKVQFDFVVHHAAVGLYEDEIQELGGKIYHFTVLDDKNVVKYISELNRFFDEHKEYQIIHGHLSSLAVFYLGVAKEYNVPWRIAHSHGAGFLHTLKGTAKYLLFRTTKWNANVRLACSTEAGKYLYGKDTFEFVPNGIDVDRFTFDENKRIEMRKMLGIRDEYVIGHVGRFNLQKNHEYLLRIFKEVQQKTPNIKLLLLGEGELFSKIQNLAEDLEIKDKIIFAGVHKDVENYYQAMDAFVLPSLFEGLPVTGIEAQYSGLPCFFSDEVTREVKICSDTKFLKIGNENLGLWVDAISQQRINKERNKIELITKKFDIRTAAKSMEKRYIDLWKQSNS